MNTRGELRSGSGLECVQAKQSQYGWNIQSQGREGRRLGSWALALFGREFGLPDMSSESLWEMLIKEDDDLILEIF